MLYQNLVNELHVLLLESQVNSSAILQFSHLMREKLKEIGLARFVEEVAMPLGEIIGDSLEQCQLSVFMEHSYTVLMVELLSEFILQEKKNVYEKQELKILLSSFSGEKHILGLFMVEASLCEAGAFCINLGAELPVHEIVNAAYNYEVDVIGITISNFFNKRLAKSLIKEIRSTFPPHIEIWVSGSGANFVDGIPSVKVLTDSTSLLTAYQDTKKKKWLRLKTQ